MSLRRTGRSLLLTIPREGRYPGSLGLPEAHRRIRRRLAFLPFTSAVALIAGVDVSLLPSFASAALLHLPT